MAWDGMVWVKLNRPLTDDEKMRQLKVDTVASEKLRDDFSVFSMNDVFLESTNAAFQQRGMFSYGFLAVLIAGLLVLWGGIYCLMYTPPNVGPTELAVARLFMGLLALFGLGVVLAGLWGLQKENFTWRRFPVRFNRQTRMVYAYRGAGSKGVIAVPWEKAFFYVQRRDKDAVSRTTSFNIRCHVLDSNQNVTQSFSIGSRVTTLSDESTNNGSSIVATLNDQFEYLRRYMNDGPASLPYAELVPTGVSLTNSYRLVTRTDRKVIAEGNGPVTLLIWIVRPFALLTVLLHYIGQVTSREPVWPENVSRECERQPVGQAAARREDVDEAQRLG